MKKGDGGKILKKIALNNTRRSIVNWWQFKNFKISNICITKKTSEVKFQKRKSEKGISFSKRKTEEGIPHSSAPLVLGFQVKNSDSKVINWFSMILNAILAFSSI